MKRLHLFEFEDFAWFPGWLRDCMTRYIVAIHRMMGTSELLGGLLRRALQHADRPAILDMCSGAGGPMPDIAADLRQDIPELQVTLSDLYPHQQAAARINASGQQGLHYQTSPVNATDVDSTQSGVRTMVCSMHHMRPEVARGILENAWKDEQPICIYEISDNSFPKWIWWIAFPINVLMVFFITPLVRPMTWQQLVFTYLIPVLPFLIGWDGAVSNARTYTPDDMDILLKGLDKPGYTWEKGTLKGKGGNKLYLMGLPST